MTTTNPIGPSSSSSTYPYTYGYPWVSTSTSSPLLTDEMSVACPDCSVIYIKRASTAAEAELACQEWLDGHRSEQHATAEHLTLSDGTVLRDRTAGSLGLCGNGVRPSSRGLLKLAAEHLEAAVLEPGKMTLDEADVTAIATLARHALDS